MFYIQQNEKIVLFDEDKQKLQDTIAFTPQYQGLEIKEVEEGYVIHGFELMTVEEMEAKQAQKERERLDMLFLTGADVERGIYQAKGMDFDDIMAFVMANPPQGLDVKALKIELKANNFYRGNQYVNAVGALLGFTTEQLDKFFKTKDYTYLLPSEQVEDKTDQVSEQATEDNGTVEASDTSSNSPVVSDEVTDENSIDTANISNEVDIKANEAN